MVRRRRISMSEETQSLEQNAPLTTEDDTPTLDSSPDSSDTGISEDVLAKIEELENRVAGQTRSWQQLKQEKEQLEQRLSAWKQAGIDPDEIDSIVNEYSDSGVSNELTGSKKVVTPEQLEERLRWQEGQIRWDLEKANYFRQNPDYDSEDVRNWFDAQARDIIAREIQQYGQVQTTDVKKLLGKTIKNFKRLEAIVAKRKEKELTTQETKLKETGLPATKAATPPDTSGDDDKLTKEGYVANHQSHLNKIRGLI